jgi:hypothetical protein
VVVAQQNSNLLETVKLLQKQSNNTTDGQTFCATAFVAQNV